MTTAFRTHPAAIDEVVDDGLAVRRLDRESVFSLNGSAAHLWRFLRTSRSYDELARELAASFAVEPGRARTDVHALVGALLEAELLEPVAAAEPASAAERPVTGRVRSAALRYLGRALGGGAPDGGGTDTAFWEAVLRIAARHQLSALLWCRLRACPGGATAVPDWAARRLAEAYRLNAERNRSLRAQVVQAAAALNRAGIEPLLLKGGAHLIGGLYADPAARVMGDIDLLVPPARLAQAGRVLAELGYRPEPGGPVDYDRHHHAAPLLHPCWDAPLELHHMPLLPAYAALLPIHEVWTDSVPAVVDDLRMRLPSPAHRLVHAVVHAQLVDRAYFHGRLPLRELCDAVWLYRSFPDLSGGALLGAAQRRYPGAVTGFFVAGRRLLAPELALPATPCVASYLYWWRALAAMRWEGLAQWQRRFDRLAPTRLRRECDGSGIPAVIGRALFRAVTRDAVR